MSRDYEKRRFVETASVAILLNSDKLLATQRSPRSIVNLAIELWDEIEAQAPDKERRGD